MSRGAGQRGQSVLYAVLLMPMLFLVFALAIDIGLMQLERLRLQYAVGLATVTAATSIDREFYGRTGQLRLEPEEATRTTREYVFRNLNRLADTANPEEVSNRAEIRVINLVPARDPFNGSLIDRPAICARIQVPHRFSLLGWVGLSSFNLTVSASAQVRP